MPRSTVRSVALVVFLAAAAGCASGPENLSTALAVTDVFSGYYDNGLKNGMNHLVPSVTFRLKNQWEQPLSSVQLTIDFWRDGADGPQDSSLIRGIGSDAVQPGQSTEPITVRASSGYTLVQPRAELFTHSDFRDMTVKIFGKRGGRIVPLGEYRIDRRLLPHIPGTLRP